MEKVTERKTDYFLRYTAEIPADELYRHEPFSRGCPCRPDVDFDEKEGWHHLTHNRMNLVEQGG